ncbi:PepSY domain-containing protein [Modicisalibacter tunisiensis]|uniref:Peptidase n=1 Tax=Modicisalibacter tunisiensis TaxID=390637 RepID=A0ABS7WV29_9GAMM|nr:PepSY domain-containing protein [Modicisalibacter tunisiensis]MBZ9566464.1 peptidase [Modicisalibacter tunisiensis]
MNACNRLLATGVVVLGTALVSLPPAAAEDDWHGLHDAVRAGRLVALPGVLDWLQQRYAGQVLEVELEHEDEAIRYDIEMIGPDGQLVEFVFDAATGELVDSRGQDIDAMKRR